MKEALYWEVFDEEKKAVRCLLCPKECIVAPDKTGFCRARKNIDGKLYSQIYEQFTSIALDPIEKKPLYHFYPGREILSLGTVGCNFACEYCQNWEISQGTPGEISLRQATAQEIISLAKQYNSIGIAYTYNEPLINYEFVLDTARRAHQCNLKNVLVTNAMISEKPLYELLPYIDAANVDLKSFKNEFYQKYCKGEIGPVLRNIEIFSRQENFQLELTNLLIPSLNDSEQEIKDIVDWIYSLSEEIPLHFSRYFPQYKFTIKPTPYPTLQKARRIALEKLKYVYLGNVMEELSSHTYCPQCKELLIERHGYQTRIKNLTREGFCGKCGAKINVAL